MRVRTAYERQQAQVRTHCQLCACGRGSAPRTLRLRSAPHTPCPALASATHAPWHPTSTPCAPQGRAQRVVLETVVASHSRLSAARWFVDAVALQVGLGCGLISNT